METSSRIQKQLSEYKYETLAVGGAAGVPLSCSSSLSKFGIPTLLD
jgi:hypothetical protein